MQMKTYQGDGTIYGGDGWMVVSFRLDERQAAWWGYEPGAWMVVRTTHKKGDPEGPWNITWRIFQ